MLKFSSNASAVEKVVDSDLIEPLLISDVSIKAKKKDWLIFESQIIYETLYDFHES